MSQVKVEQYKSEKANRKNWKAQKRLESIKTWAIAAVCVIIIGLGIYFGTHASYSDVNTGASVYDDFALAEIVGYDGVEMPKAE